MLIDYELYDRQIRIFGIESMIKIINGTVSIIGLEKGLATEILKNLISCGINKINLYDDALITESDLLTGYYYSINDINNLRCDIIRREILKLNYQMEITCNSYYDLLESNVIICINQSEDNIIKYNDICRTHNIKFISLKSSNNKGVLFVDAGNNYSYLNTTHEPVQILSCNYKNNEITFITNGHEFQSGDTIKFIKLQGTNIDILNYEFIINVISKWNFKISLLIPEKFNFINGTVIHINKSIIINHEAYETKNNYTHSDIEIIPVNSIMGSLTAFEAIKLISRKYKPISQWFEWCDNDLNYELAIEKLKESTFFIVGSGSIGCELLKNLAFLNVKKIIITDSDIINKSNLSTHFLFNTLHIFKYKSEIATQIIKKIKPNINIDYYTQNVNASNINFTDNILKTNDLTAVFTALDNVDSRRFMDNECFNYDFPLFDSGTMDNKGHVQSIIPYLTETYSDLNDLSSDESYPVCTIKNFPSKIHHTIQWALEQF